MDHKTLTSSVASFLQVLSLAAQAGIARDEFCRNVGVDTALLNDPDARIPSSIFRILYSEAVKRSGDELFWLRVKPREALLSNNLVLYTFCTAANFSDAMKNSERYFRVITDYFYPSLIGSQDEAVIRFTFRLPDEEILPYSLDMILSSYSAFDHMWGGGALKLRGLRLTPHFSHRRAAYEEYFGVPVDTHQPYNERVFDRDALDMPNTWTRHDPALGQFLLQQAKTKLEALPQIEDFRSRLIEELKRRLPHGTPDIKDVASRLALSPRSLQRQLTEQGTTFKDQLHQLRSQLATHHLRQAALSISQIAFLLGFQDGRSFTVAFRKWHGITPTEYRAQHRAPT